MCYVPANNVSEDPIAVLKASIILPVLLHLISSFPIFSISFSLGSVEVQFVCTIPTSEPRMITSSA